jgi:hypothetical protein
MASHWPPEPKRSPTLRIGGFYTLLPLHLLWMLAMALQSFLRRAFLRRSRAMDGGSKYRAKGSFALNSLKMIVLQRVRRTHGAGKRESKELRIQISVARLRAR